MTQTESPKRKMQKKNDYQRNKLFRKIKRRRKAQAEAEQQIAEKQLRRKLKLPKFGDGKEKVNLDNAHFDKEGNLVDNNTGVKYIPTSDDVVITPNTKYFYDPYASAGNYFDGNQSKDFINMTPGIGDAMDVAQVVDDTSKGKYISAGAGAAMLALPNFVEKPFKFIGKKALPFLFNKINTKSIGNQYSKLFKNLESDGNLMQIDDILKEYSKEGHFRMPVYQDKFDVTTNISPLQLFMSRQTAAGRNFKPNVVYKGTTQSRDYLMNHHPGVDVNGSGSYTFIGSYKNGDPYQAVIDKKSYKSRKDMEQGMSHEFTHSLQDAEDDYGEQLALKAFGNTPISNKYFLDGAHLEFGARGSQLKNALGIYGNLKRPLKISPKDYQLAIDLYPYRFKDNNITDMANYTSDNKLAAKFIQSEGFNSGKDIHIKPSKRGTFTKAAKQHGMSVQGFANRVLRNPSKYSASMRKKANFAHNAASWKH